VQGKLKVKKNYKNSLNKKSTNKEENFLKQVNQKRAICTSEKRGERGKGEKKLIIF